MKKTCSECQKKKDVSMFYRKKEGWYSTKCKRCLSAYYKKRYEPRKVKNQEYRQTPTLTEEQASRLAKSLYF